MRILMFRRKASGCDAVIGHGGLVEWQELQVVRIGFWFRQLAEILLFSASWKRRPSGSLCIATWPKPIIVSEQT